MKIGYCRVSTKRQSLQTQINLLHNLGITDIYSDKFTGKVMDRPQFDEMMSHLRKGDEVDLVRLDRFARNMRMALNAIHDIRIKGCTMKVFYPYPMDIVKRVKANNKQGWKLKTVNTDRIYTALMFAEDERKAILWRTKMGRLTKERADPQKYHQKMGRKTRIDKYKAWCHDVWFYKEKQHHSARQTALHFTNQTNGRDRGNHISMRTVYRVVNSYKKYLKKHHKVDQ